VATIQKEIVVEAAPDVVWDAIRDVGAIHTRLASGFVTDTRLDGDSRIVTFANGAVVRERIITVDDRNRRLVYSVVEWKATHHNASFQVFDAGHRQSRVVWIVDLLPDDLAPLMDGLMQQGCEAMKRTLGHQVART
jgi:hypothetical protein